MLADEQVQAFIGTPQYEEHKKKRFPADDYATPINKNEAFLLNDPAIRDRLQKRYEATKALYYKGQPPFDNVIKRIQSYVDLL